MAAYEHLRYCDELEAEVDRLAAAVNEAELDLFVPTCPEWTVRVLVDHCGGTLLWGGELVSRRSQARLSGRSLQLSPPDGRSGDPAWLRECGARLLSALRAADPDETMWAWGEDQHVRFWSRRMLHEMLVHRVDLLTVSGSSIDVAPEIAADCLDEFFVNLRRAAEFSPRVLEIAGGGETIAVQCSDVPDSWTVAMLPRGFSIVSGAPPTPDVRVTGTARDLMLLFNRRAALSALPVEIAGDLGVLEGWLDKSALE
ncbi:MAG: maleylpyruvate isomerase family mycothiol-dependent enzyme [Actinomycetota bacterium]